MARCESVDVLRDIISDDKVQKMESSDSDSDSIISCNSNLDTNGERKEMYPMSLESINDEPQVNTGPVLSLRCLHEDSDDEEKESSRSSAKSKFEFLDVGDVPELSVDCGEDDDPEDSGHEPEDSEEVQFNHPHLLPVKIVAVNGSSNANGALISHSHSSIPARSNWDGAHNFKIRIQCNGCPRKSESPVYSESRNKLYIAKDHPFKILVSAENVPVGSMIKVTAVFSLAEHSYKIVQRCPTHVQQDYSKGNAACEHFVQCFSEAAIYEKNTDSGKLSVSVPYENPQEGEAYTTYLFKLTCFSSCMGGINRRPFMLVFTLEKDNIPVGRQTLEAKVCACPLRDLKVDEIKLHKSRSKNEKTAINEDPEWFDEKVHLSVLDTNGLLDHHNETQTLMEDASTFLLGLLGSNFNPSQFSADIFKNEKVDFSKELDVQELVADSASSEILDSHLASPRCNTLQVDFPAFNPMESPASPYSDIPEESSSSALQSPEALDIPLDSLCNSLDSSPFQVTVCDNVASPSSSEPVLSLGEVSRSVRKRKYVNDGESRPKIVKVILPEDIPVSRKSKTKNSRERRKEQVKEAAARYRIKRRMEEKIRSDEIENLELYQKELQKKNDDLQTKIKYLKSLMCKILIKKE